MSDPLLKRLLGDLPPARTPEGDEAAFRRLEREFASRAGGGLARRLSIWLAPVGAAAALGLFLIGRPAPTSTTTFRHCHPGTKCLENFATAMGPSSPAEPPPAIAAPTPIAAPAPPSAPRPPPIVALAHAERIPLPDGSLALLERGSRLSVERRDPSNVVLSLEAGAVFVHAAHHDVGSLVVRAGDCSVVVHGTGFRVWRRERSLSVGLWHGSVELRDASGASRFLRPGEELRHADGEPLAVASVGPLRDREEGRAEEAELLGRSPAPAPREPRRRASGSPPAEARADVRRCLAQTRSTTAAAALELDLTLADDGRVLSSGAEPGQGDARLASCVAEAALHWRLDPPLPALRGLQFVYPVPLK